jgi:hypothetical protein
MYRVTSRTGEHVGDVEGTTALKALLDANPGATYKAVVHIANPCPTHPAFSADYCPGCGTAVRVGSND